VVDGPARRSRRGRVPLVAGPGLRGAAPEIAELAGAYPAAVRLDGPAATIESALSALDGADVAHVAAHGGRRGDNPLFSAFALADGPLSAYDLERLSTPGWCCCPLASPAPATCWRATR
jgi:CHAT domain